MASYQLVTPSYDEAHAHLTRDVEAHLALLGALEYDPVGELRGVARDGVIVGLALMLEPDGPPTHARTPVMLTANNADALQTLLHDTAWPEAATFVVARRDLLPALEAHVGVAHDGRDGLLHFVADDVPKRAHPLVRPLTLDDAEALDLAPCNLSPTALRNWLRRGWRAWGAVQERVLLAHALAAYPVAGTEEVSAVFSAPQSRRQGLASAIVAATIADITERGQQAVYVCRRANIASQRVAQGLGLRLASETWEVFT